MTSHMVDWLLDPLPPGTQVGPWRLVRHRGGGSYGTVYLAEKVGAPQEGPFALKLATTSMDMRFEREAALLSRIRSPHVPVLRDWGMWIHPSSVPLPYLVMDWVEGVSLYDWAAQSPRTSRQVLWVLAQLARALDATHRARCQHRDVKGDNMLVSPEGRAFLMDFGAGKFQGARQLTYALLPPGTPQYRSPQAQRFQWAYREQPAAQYEYTEADDVYSLGVAAYRAVTGTYPPPGFDLARAVDPSRPPQPPLQPPEKLATVCRELNTLILRMLSDAPEARGSAAELAHALEQAAARASAKADTPIKLRPRQTAARWRTRRVLTSAALGLATAVGCAVVAISTARKGNPREEQLRVVQQSPEENKEVRDTVALGDSCPLVSEVRFAPPASSQGFGLEMPKRPFPGQMLPPCKGVNVVIELTPGRSDTRSCWVEVKAPPEKCKENGYEYKGGCYLPSPLPQKLPQSIRP
jgi:serine/threonine protein kinase